MSDKLLHKLKGFVVALQSYREKPSKGKKSRQQAIKIARHGKTKYKVTCFTEDFPLKYVYLLTSRTFYV